MIFNKATSVPVERAFSGGADLIAAKRCSLKADTISAWGLAGINFVDNDFK